MISGTEVPVSGASFTVSTEAANWANTAADELISRGADPDRLRTRQQFLEGRLAHAMVIRGLLVAWSAVPPGSGTPSATGIGSSGPTRSPRGPRAVPAATLDLTTYRAAGRRPATSANWSPTPASPIDDVRGNRRVPPPLTLGGVRARGAAGGSGATGTAASRNKEPIPGCMNDSDINGRTRTALSAVPPDGEPADRAALTLRAARRE